MRSLNISCALRHPEGGGRLCLFYFSFFTVLIHIVLLLISPGHQLFQCHYNFIIPSLNTYFVLLLKSPWHQLLQCRYNSIISSLNTLCSLKSSRRLPIIWAAVLSHHRAYRSVHGGSMNCAVPLTTCLYPDIQVITGNHFVHTVPFCAFPYPNARRSLRSLGFHPPLLKSAGFHRFLPSLRCPYLPLTLEASIVQPFPFSSFHLSGGPPYGTMASVDFLQFSYALLA
jgi:hypothetical protein